jgi:DNA-binding GntR family transcriptional regulator
MTRIDAKDVPRQDCGGRPFICALSGHIRYVTFSAQKPQQCAAKFMPMTAPAYRKIADALRRKIAGGKFPPGALLPTEYDICAAYGVSRHTARDALRILSEEGLIERRRGAGSIVSDAAKGGFTQSLTGLDDLLQYARDAKLQILKLASRAPHTPDMAALKLDPKMQWSRIDGVRGGAIRPIALTTIYVRADLCPSATQIASWPGALNELIAKRSGVRTARIDQRINAVTLTASQAKPLGEKKSAAALRTVRIYVDAKNDVFQASISLHPGARFTYAMTLEASATKTRGT